MSGEIIGKEAILGQMQDEGYTSVLVNRVGELLTMCASDDIEEFSKATKGQMQKAYNDCHPGAKSLGAQTFEAVGRFLAIWRDSKYDAKQVAQEMVGQTEVREMEKAQLRTEALTMQMESATLKSALEAMEYLGRKRFTLKRLLDLYDMARGDGQEGAAA